MKPTILALLLTATSALAQMPPPPGGPMGPPPTGGPPPPQAGGGGDGGLIRDFFFPPEVVMRNQRAIALTADQQNAIRAEMQKALPQFTELQWQQSAEEEAMADLAKSDHPDESKILAQLDKLTSIENAMKRTQLTLMVRIKNLLTPDQQQKLRSLEKDARGKGGGRPIQGASPAPPAR